MLPQQDASELTANEASISELQTAPMFAIRPGQVEQQQNMLLNAAIEDIAYQATLKLPVLSLKAGERSLTDKHRIIVSTAGSAAIAGSGDLIFAALRYLINVVMTNIVSASIYGTYMAVYTSALIVGSIAELGLDSTMVRFLSTYRVKGERGLAVGLIRFVVWMTLISGLLCCILFFLFASALAHLIYHQDAYALPLKESTLLIPLVALQLVFGSGLQALKAIKLKVLVDRLIHPALTLVLVVIFYLLGLRLEALILATICGFLASVITGQILLHKAAQKFIADAAPKFETKTWLRFALPMSFYTFIQNVMNSTDVLFLTAFATASQVGLYSAADRTSIFVVMPILALNTIFSPLIAEYYTRGEHEQLANMSRLVTKWSFSLSLPVFLCFFVFHDPILSIFSREYTTASTVLIILSFSNLVNAIAGTAGSLLVMTGHARLVLINTAATIVINIVMAFILVPRFNIVGAAIAAALAVVILDVAYFIETYRILKLLAFRGDMFKSVIAGAAASAVGLVLLRVIHVGYGYRAIFGSLSLVISFLLVYVSVLGLLRFSKEDKVVFDAVLAKVRTKKHP